MKRLEICGLLHCVRAILNHCSLFHTSTHTHTRTSLHSHAPTHAFVSRRKTAFVDSQCEATRDSLLEKSLLYLLNTRTHSHARTHSRTHSRTHALALSPSKCVLICCSASKWILMFDLFLTKLQKNIWKSNQTNIFAFSPLLRLMLFSFKVA